jgi:hypothetical protein
MLDLMEKGVSIPPHLIEDLKSGRTLIGVHNAGPQEPDASEPTPFLQMVEANLMSLAETELGMCYADVWQVKISETYTEEGTKTPPPAKFVSGIPKGEHWVRIDLSQLSAEGEAKELLSRLNLSSRQEEDGYLLIHGSKEDISVFLKELRKFVSKAGL